MILPFCILAISAIASVISARSFRRRCTEAARNYDPIKASSPRGLVKRTSLDIP